MRSAVREQLVFGEVRIASDHEQLDRFAGARIGYPDRCTFANMRMGGYDRLDLVRKNLEPRDGYHVFLAVDDPDLAHVVHDANITGAEVAIRGHGLGSFGR